MPVSFTAVVNIPPGRVVAKSDKWFLFQTRAFAMIVTL
jgi:hypothetical protein